MGEHAVVYGQPAIACALTQRIEIEWTHLNGDQIHILSEFGEYKCTWQTLDDHPNLKWVIHALKAFQDHINTGLKINITSQINTTQGLGSSAALLAALLGGLNTLSQQNHPLNSLFKMGLNIIHAIQKRGSGTDLAAALYGGMILFEPNQHKITTLPVSLDLILIYCGYKTPTAQVLQWVSEKWQTDPNLLQDLYALMGTTTRNAYTDLINQDMNAFYRKVNTYQGLMDALGVNDQTLSQIVYDLRAAHWPASKISGSGLGDSVIGFGQAEPFITQHQQIHAQISPDGMISEKFTLKKP